jgi:hypothetical protein
MRKEIHRKIRRHEPGIDIVADVDAVMDINISRGNRRASGRDARKSTGRREEGSRERGPDSGSDS